MNKTNTQIILDEIDNMIDDYCDYLKYSKKLKNRK